MLQLLPHGPTRTRSMDPTPNLSLVVCLLVLPFHHFLSFFMVAIFLYRIHWVFNYSVRHHLWAKIFSACRPFQSYDTNPAALVTVKVKIQLTHEKIISDPSLHTGTFSFQNKSTISCVVANGTTGNPIFISPTELPPGIDKLTPKSKVKVWFGQSFETASMISIDTTENYSIDLTGSPSQDVWYTEQGTWSPTKPTE